MTKSQSKNSRYDRFIALLQAHNVDHLIFHRQNDLEWIRFFRMQPEWQVDLEDENSILFIRTALAPITLGG